MKLNTCLLASALALAPLAAAQAADCSTDLTRIADQLKAAKAVTVPPVAEPHRARSAWAITWNRMATASENANAATLAPAAVPPTGAEDAAANEPGWASGNTLQRATSAIAAAKAAHVRGDDAMCRQDIADAQQLLNTLS